MVDESGIETFEQKGLAGKELSQKELTGAAYEAIDTVHSKWVLSRVPEFVIARDHFERKPGEYKVDEGIVVFQKDDAVWAIDGMLSPGYPAVTVLRLVLKEGELLNDQLIIRVHGVEQSWGKVSEEAKMELLKVWARETGKVYEEGLAQVPLENTPYEKALMSYESNSIKPGRNTPDSVTATKQLFSRLGDVLARTPSGSSVPTPATVGS